jgi:Tol biopolymer transport system component
MRRSTSVVLLLFACAACNAPSVDDAAKEAVALEGPYLGQVAPGSEPELFAPGLVSTGMHTRDMAMSPEGDEIYFSIQAGPLVTILGSRLVDGVWTEPEVADFSSDPTVGNIEPHISPDGSRFFFVSNRLADGSPLPEAERGRWERADIWMMERAGAGWGTPQRVPEPVSTEAQEYFPSTTADGTLYFTREDPENGRNYIYRARPEEVGYGDPERLPEQVNSANQFNSFVSPDESYLILGVFGREDSEGGTDYYVVFRSADDTWSEPVNLGPVVNQARGEEWSPYVSPDGKYFFFMSARQPYPADAPDRLTRDWLLDFHQGPESGNPSVYWMDAGFIEGLRGTAATPSAP